MIAIAVTLAGVTGALAASPAQAVDHGSARCSGTVSRAVIPSWARAGFSAPKPRLPHVVGRSGAIAALLFGYPLQAPHTSAGRSNKILWVPRNDQTGVAALHIRAQRMTGAQRVGRPVTRTVPGGPGPSIVDLPAAGCWRLTLTWSGRSDTLDLRYGAPASR